MNKNYIWYACYGSNLLKERFMHYIRGGVCRFNGRPYQGCIDQNEPLEDRPCIIKHDLYFGNRSSTWNNGGVAFLDPERNENAATLGRMFLITEEQFKEVQSQEGPSWYNKVIDLGIEEGVPIKTFTHSTRFPSKEPSQNYVSVVREGLSETYPSKTTQEINDYLQDKIFGR